LADSPEDTLIRRIVVERQLVTQEELKAAEQTPEAQTEPRRPIGEVLVELGYLTRSQMARLQGLDDSGGRPAQQLPGYQLQKRVGAGAMAVVYRARQISLDRTVAVKVLPKRLSKNAEFVERFYREGRAAAQLNHNNIVQAIDVGESGGFHYFVMEFVEGVTVYDELASGKIYTEKESIVIIRQIADALKHAHERGFIHRDVKPKNIMLTTERVAKLADMGLAREASDVQAAMAEAGRAYGTPYYISPEQIRGEVDIDQRADLYSLGATWYHMVTGRVPFEAPTPSAVMHKHLKDPLIPPDHISTRLSSGCGAMIEMLMAKNRDERYPSARELLSDLDLLARGEPPHYALHHVDHQELEQLSEGKSVGPPRLQPPPHRPAISLEARHMPVITILLGAALLISIVVNIAQALRR
jgi:serine/threonine protein kinase